MLVALKPKADEVRSLARNRRARHEYEILAEYEAGIVLQGSEVKSLRAGRASIQEAYVMIRGGQAELLGANIPEYAQAGPYHNHPPDRPRRLLLHRRELDELEPQVTQKGVTVVPLEVLLRGDWVKVSLALVRGKKLHDKRETLKARDAQREMDRALGRRR
jgi:SsrA-binding protein